MSDVFIAKGPRLAARKVGGEMVILSADWEAADGRTTVQAIVADVICREFDIDGESAARDVDEFVRELSSHGILRTSAEAIVDAEDGADGRAEGIV